MREIILGSAVTGAKFTPRNHRVTRNSTLDAAASGSTIKHRLRDVIGEAHALADLGGRYWHFHARNPRTNEQSTSNTIYRSASHAVQHYDDSVLISFGASRNGAEVRHAIGAHGEWERVSQAAIPLHLGGAHFVTTQAAVELHIINDLVRSSGPFHRQDVLTEDFAELARSYTPSTNQIDASLDTYSTSFGAVYGSTSPATQLATMAQAISERNRLYLPHEVEWVQLERSFATTRLAMVRPDIALGSTGQLNITLLFGFSPLFPFPHRYEQFLDAVRLAKSLEIPVEGNLPVHISISVGAAVIPQHHRRHYAPLDVGVDQGRFVGPLQRLVHYACQPDSQVDIIRSGMEDTPFHISDVGELALTDNVELLKSVLDIMAKYEVAPLVSKSAIITRLHLAELVVQCENHNAKVAALVESLHPRI